MSHFSGCRQFLLGILGILVGVGWIRFCYWMGWRSGEEWIAFVGCAWSIAGWGLFLTIAGAMVGAVGLAAKPDGNRNAERMAICGLFAFLAGIIALLAGLGWVLLYCAVGAWQGEKWAEISMFGCGLVGFGILIIATAWSYRID